MKNTSPPVDNDVVSVFVVVVVLLLLLLCKRIGGSGGDGGGRVNPFLLMMMMMMSPMAIVKLSVLLFPFLLFLYEYYSSSAIFNCFYNSSTLL